jgi:hypothetical protein
MTPLRGAVTEERELALVLIDRQQLEQRLACWAVMCPFPTQPLPVLLNDLVSAAIAADDEGIAEGGRTAHIVATDSANAFDIDHDDLLLGLKKIKILPLIFLPSARYVAPRAARTGGSAGGFWPPFLPGEDRIYYAGR